MNNYRQVDQFVSVMKSQGIIAAEIIWRLSLACVEWPYVFGAAGALCTPSNRKARASAAHPTIVSSCQVLNGKKDFCNGCKWLPDGVNVRQFDCRGFTRWTAAQVGITITGSGATSQWNNDSNWSRKGTIASMPQNQLVCLFVKKGEKMEHTGWGLNDETVECSNGVQHFTKRKKKWTHWAIPRGLEGAIPLPDVKQTLKRGNKGPLVTELQNDLMQLGYQLPRFGADGDFGAETQAALLLFQKDNRLTPDGICGPLTWSTIESLISSEQRAQWTVIIPDLSETEARELLERYPAGRMQKGDG